MRLTVLTVTLVKVTANYLFPAGEKVYENKAKISTYEVEYIKFFHNECCDGKRFLSSPSNPLQ
jgi:hypothetical protein